MYKRQVLKSASDKFGSPTSTIDLSKAILNLLQTNAYGLYHITNSGIASRYDYVKCIVDAFEIDITVEPVDSSEFLRPSPVPNCEALSNLNLTFLGIEQPPPWQEAIHSYVQELRKVI